MCVFVTIVKDGDFTVIGRYSDHVLTNDRYFFWNCILCVNDFCIDSLLFICAFPVRWTRGSRIRFHSKQALHRRWSRIFFPSV